MVAPGRDEQLEVGRLHVGLLAARNIKKINRGGVGDFLGLASQQKAFCKITLGEHEFTSSVGVRTTAGFAWNREQMFFPVKVPLSCVVGVAEQWHEISGSSTGGNREANEVARKGHVSKDISTNCTDAGRRRKGATTGVTPSGGRGDTDNGVVGCGSSLFHTAADVDGAAVHGLWSRLTLRVQVFHGEHGPTTSETMETAAAGGQSETVLGGITRVDMRAKTPGGGPTSKSGNISDTTNDECNGGRDRLIGECSLNLVEVVSGRVPHIEEWVPLDSEGELKLSLDYDPAREVPMPGDAVVLLCLSNRLDFFPLPVWDVVDDPARPWSASWLWARDASRWSTGYGGSDTGESGGGFRLEEPGDDFFLISFATPEGWRCAVEVHRFLVYRDPTAPRRWTFSGVRDHAIATPAAAAIRGIVLRARQEESAWDGGMHMANSIIKGLFWTFTRWWGGGVTRIRDDISFAVGLMDSESFYDSDKHQNNELEGKGEQEEEACGWRTTDEVNTPQKERWTDGNDRVDDCKQVEEVSAANAGTELDSPMVTVRDSLSSVSCDPPEQQQHLCPITRCPMKDPAVASDGFTYERAAIERWLLEHDTSPVTGKLLETKVIFKNWSLVSSLPSAAAQGK